MEIYEYDVRVYLFCAMEVWRDGEVFPLRELIPLCRV